MTKTKAKKPYDALVEILILNGAAKGLAGSVATAMLCKCCRKPRYPTPSAQFLSCPSGTGKLIPFTVPVAEIFGGADLLRPDELWKQFRRKTHLSKMALLRALRGQEPPKPPEKERVLE